MSHLKCTIDSQQNSNSVMSQMKNIVKLRVMPRKSPTRLYDDFDEEDNEWIKLMSTGEYIVGIRDTCIYRYNARNNDWNLIMDVLGTLTDEHGCWIPLLFVEKDTNRLYISCALSGMVIIELNSGSIIHQGPETFMEDRCLCSSMVKVDDIFHTVQLREGYVAIQHDVWNGTDQKWEENQDIEDFSGFQRWTACQMFQFASIEATSVIYVPSQNIILLFCGGISDCQYRNLGLWRYRFEQGQWTRIAGIEFDFIQSGIVLTADERYVVIVGGEELCRNDGSESKAENQDDIFVLDIQNNAEYKLWGTSIRFPRPHAGKTSYTDITVNDAVSTLDSYSIFLTSGWIRKLFASAVLVEILFPPLVIIEMIEKYRNNEETIHCVTTEQTNNEETAEFISRDENHYAVPLRQILSSMSATPHQIGVEGTNYWTDVCKTCRQRKDHCRCADVI